VEAQLLAVLAQGLVERFRASSVLSTASRPTTRAASSSPTTPPSRSTRSAVAKLDLRMGYNFKNGIIRGYGKNVPR
jgi:hypothetical protein